MSQHYQSLEEDEDEEISPCLGTKPKASAPKVSPWKSLKLLGGRLSASPERHYKTITGKSSPWATFKRSLSSSFKGRHNSTDSGFTSHNERTSVSSSSSRNYGSIPDSLWTDWRDGINKASSSSSDTSVVDDSLCDPFCESPPLRGVQSPKKPIRSHVQLAPPKIQPPVQNRQKSLEFDLSDSVRKLEANLDTSIPIIDPPPLNRRHTVCFDSLQHNPDVVPDDMKLRSQSDSRYDQSELNRGSSTNLFIVSSKSQLNTDNIYDENDEINNDDDDEIAMFMKPMLQKKSFPKEAPSHSKPHVKKLLKDIALEASDSLQPLGAVPFAKSFEKSTETSEAYHKPPKSNSKDCKDIREMKSLLKKTSPKHTHSSELPDFFADEIRLKSNVRRCNELLDLLGQLKESLPCDNIDEDISLFSSEDCQKRPVDESQELLPKK